MKIDRNTTNIVLLEVVVLRPPNELSVVVPT